MIQCLFDVEVKEEEKWKYQPEWLHRNVGYIWEEDENKLYFKFVKTDLNTGKPYISGPHCYLRADINYNMLKG